MSFSAHFLCPTFTSSVHQLAKPGLHHAPRHVCSSLLDLSKCECTHAAASHSGQSGVTVCVSEPCKQPDQHSQFPDLGQESGQSGHKLKQRATPVLIRQQWAAKGVRRVAGAGGRGTFERAAAYWAVCAWPTAQEPSHLPVCKAIGFSKERVCERLESSRVRVRGAPHFAEWQPRNECRPT
jgi:hypothetical protein